VAAVAGEVRFAGVAGSSGLTVSVRTDDGFDTSYLHLGATTVRAGERVSAGQRLGVVGTSGVRSAAAPHLHFGVREAGSRHAYRDPLAFLPPLAAPGPEPPAAVPAPAPAPAPPAVAPAPRSAPRPGRLPAPRRVPGARRVPAPRSAPGRRPVPVRPRTHAERRAPARRRLPLPSPRLAPPEPVGRRAPTAEPGGDEAGRRAPLRSADPTPAARALEQPALGTGPPEPARPPAPVTTAPGDRPTPAESRSAGSHGPDLGLALACLGVLLAAAILAFSGDARDSGRRGSAPIARGCARIAAALRPLLGRR
jgi:Peptidase family M23